MFNRAPSLGRLTLALLCLAGLIGLFLLVWCRQMGNSSSTKVVIPVATKPAHLTLFNCSPCEWQIVVKPVTGGERHVLKLLENKSLDIEFPGGDYAVEQTMLTDYAGPDSTRRFTLQLRAGEFYRWQLVSLLSGTAEDLHLQMGGTDGHE